MFTNIPYLCYAVSLYKVGDFYFQYFKSRTDCQSAIIGLL